LPKGNGKGYSPEMNDCTLQKRYSLPSALADGNGKNIKLCGLCAYVVQLKKQQNEKQTI
jgi:hypothetical protein